MSGHGRRSSFFAMMATREQSCVGLDWIAYVIRFVVLPLIG